MPIVLPHKLIPWLVRLGVWADVGLQQLREYWEHRENYAGVQAPSSCATQPVWLWGDDCRYGKKINQKVMVVMLGAVLNSNKDSYSSCYPLCACGVAAKQQYT